MANPFALTLLIDRKTSHASAPCDATLTTWATTLLEAYCPTATLSIRLVDEIESAALNHQYRQKTGPTNILSFEFEAPLGVPTDILGDIVLCPTLIEKEVADIALSHTTLEMRWAHLVIHGCLHLLGYHHSDTLAAQQMEALEIEYLAKLGYSNPYE